MNRVNALVAIAVMAVMAGCAKKEAPSAHPQGEDDDVAAAVKQAPEAATAEPIIDRSKSASEMMAMIDPAPQCQQYRDALEATGKARGTMDELNKIIVQAYKAGCGKKKQQ